ncbi:MAG TPA: hypothetical protein VHX86_11835 [Tepidisphaeraceae bacterium]|jgi:hypothetical protein|nr:hypothetical protein [Tepidisphaeraceae bacterium]
MPIVAALPRAVQSKSRIDTMRLFSTKPLPPDIIDWLAPMCESRPHEEPVRQEYDGVEQIIGHTVTLQPKPHRLREIVDTLDTFCPHHFVNVVRIDVALDFVFDTRKAVREFYDFIVNHIVFPRSIYCPWFYDREYLSCIRKWGRSQWKIYVRPESFVLRVEKTVTSAQSVMRVFNVQRIGDILKINHAEFWHDNFKLVTVNFARLGRRLRIKRNRNADISDYKLERTGRALYRWLRKIYEQRPTAALLNWWIKSFSGILIDDRDDRPILTPIGTDSHYYVATERPAPLPPRPCRRARFSSGARQSLTPFRAHFKCNSLAVVGPAK